MSTSAEQFAARSLALLDKLPLECDGASRALSYLLQRDGIEHEVHVGSLEISGVGRIGLHWWVQLPGGVVCDARASMWLGSDPRVPHGVFLPSPQQIYRTHDIHSLEFSPLVFWILTGKVIEDYPSTWAGAYGPCQMSKQF